MTRALLIAPQWIGDAVMSEPLIARLAARGERVTVAALPWVAPVYRAMEVVETVEELPFGHGRLDWSARRRLGKAWRGRFDCAYVLPNSIKAALLPWLARIPRRIGYQGEGRPLLLTQRLPNPDGRPPMVAFYSALAGPPSAAEAQAHPVLRFERSRIDALCHAQDLTPGGFFAFAPGAEYGPAKCWPAAHYAALAASLYARHRLPVLLLGSAKERALCEGIAAEVGAPGACRVLCGSLPLVDAMTLIAGARGMVSNDSGLMHVAAAFGVPQVALFGSTSPEHTPPLNERARVLWLKHELGLDCAPCFERTCRYGHTRCLAELAPARAEAALEQALEGVAVPTLPGTASPATTLVAPAATPAAPAADAKPDGETITEALMRDALFSAGTSVWSWNILDGSLSNTDTSTALLGYGPGRVAAHQDAWDQLIHPDEREANHAAYLRHARGEAPIYEHEYRALAQDGSWRWIGERGRIVEWTAGGEPARMVGTLSDITQRRRAEGEALQSAERLREIARHVPGLVFQYCQPIDGRTHFPFVSERCLDLFGITQAGLMADGGELLRRLDPADLERFLASVEQSARTMQPWTGDFRLQRADGQWRWFSGDATPQATADGSLVWYGYLHDSTDQRELEQARRDRLSAELANQTKTEFLSQVSHELRTPLNAVLGFAQVLESDRAEPLAPGQKRRVRLIRESGEHLLRMIGDLLDLTRIEAGHLEVNLHPVALATLVHECADMLDATAREAGVSLQLPEPNEAGTAWADAGRLRQVLLNLMSNAVKYNQRGGEVKVLLKCSEAQVVVEVSDNGLGIPADELPRIFEPFNRLGRQHGPIAGSGLGLAVTKALVGHMGGRISVRSSAGVGSVFSVSLPAQAADTTTAPSAA